MILQPTHLMIPQDGAVIPLLLFWHQEQLASSLPCGSTTPFSELVVSPFNNGPRLSLSSGLNPFLAIPLGWKPLLIPMTETTPLHLVEDQESEWFNPSLASAIVLWWHWHDLDKVPQAVPHSTCTHNMHPNRSFENTEVFRASSSLVNFLLVIYIQFKPE